MEQVILTGDIARGSDTGQIDVVVTGSVLNDGYITHLSKKIEDMIDRRVILTLSDHRISSGEGLVLFDKQTGI